MILHVYACCWNEKPIIPFFLNHYSIIADKIIIYDNASDDGSMELLKLNPKVEVKNFETKNEFQEDTLTRLRNNAWKDSREADWVIVVDMDELVYAKDLYTKLEDIHNAGFTAINLRNWGMIAENFDFTQTNKQAYDILQQGVWSGGWKMSVFSPKHIKEINFEAGMHTALPTGDVKIYDKPDMGLLHYKRIDFNYMLARFRSLEKRRSKVTIQRGWGVHYTFPEGLLRKHHDDFLSKKVNAVECIEEVICKI